MRGPGSGSVLCPSPRPLMMKIWPRTHESASSQVASLSPMFFGDQTLSFRLASGDLTESRISDPGDDVQANEETPGDLQRKATFVMFEIGCTIRQELMTFGAPASPDAVTGLQAARAVSCGPPRVNWQRTTAPGRRAPARHPRCQAGQFLPVSLLKKSFALSSRSLSLSPAFCSSRPALSLRSLSSGPALSLRSLNSSPALSLRSLSFAPALSTALPAAGATSLSFSPVLSSTSRVSSPPFSITAPVVDAAPASFEPAPDSLIFSPRLLVPDSMAPPAFSSLVPVVFTPDSI